MSDTIIVALITSAVTIFNVLYTNITHRRKKKSADEQAIEDGLQCLLRAEIIRCHDKYTDRKYCPIYAKESLRRAYTAYHNLGGNDVATQLYNECMALPEYGEENKNEN